MLLPLPGRPVIQIAQLMAGAGSDEPPSSASLRASATILAAAASGSSVAVSSVSSGANAGSYGTSTPGTVAPGAPARA